MGPADESIESSIPDDLLEVVRRLVARFGKADPDERLATLNLVLRLSLSRDLTTLVIPPCRKTRKPK